MLIHVIALVIYLIFWTVVSAFHTTKNEWYFLILLLIMLSIPAALGYLIGKE